MTGVEILAMEEIVVNKAFNWNIAICSFAIVFGIFILIGIIVSSLCRDWGQMNIGVSLGIALGLFAAILFGTDSGIPTEYETQYKVIISDEVTMSDFLSKYEIIEQEGRIYTVTEKE